MNRDCLDLILARSERDCFEVEKLRLPNSAVNETF